MMTAIILAGGKSRRMGRDKAFLELDGVPIIKRHLNLLKDIFSNIIIAANDPEKYRFEDVKVAGDLVLDYGPLAGIYSGLMASDTFYNFIVACDMPFLNERLIRYLITRAGSWDVVVPKVDGKYHPLFGVYSKRCIPAIDRLIKDREHRVISLYPNVKTRTISKKEITRFDEGIRSLININTQEEAELCQR